MKCLRRLALIIVLICLATTSFGQSRTPNIGYMYPAGGEQGTTFEAELGGQYLAGATNIHVIGKGVEVEILEYDRPLNNQELSIIRNRVKAIKGEMDAKKKNSGDTKKESAKKEPVKKKDSEKNSELVKEIKEKVANTKVNPKFEAMKKKIGALMEECVQEDMTPQEQMNTLRNKFLPKPNPKAQENKQLEETLRIRVALAKDVKPGDHELRLVTPRGISSPIRFYVDTLPEVLEEEPNNIPRDLLENKLLPIPTLINGQVMPGDIDRFQFKAEKGQKLIFKAQARELVPYLADAVPGWFQATLALYDSRGKEIAFADDYMFHPDPIMFFDVPTDGTYTLEIKDAIYRGRQDFVYRIAMQERYSDMVPKAEKDPVAKHIRAMLKELDTKKEKEPNNSIKAAQTIALPTLVEGKIKEKGDWDVFRFEGKADEEIVAEVYGRRLNSPIDSVLRITDKKGKMLFINDDHMDKGAGLTTHHADSYLTCKLPKDGTYFLYMGDIQNKGGDVYKYSLRVSKKNPDFELRIVPSSIAMRKGESFPLTAYVLRKDGFDGDIKLSLIDPPKGFSLDSGIISGTQEKVPFTITTGNVPEGIASLKLEATTLIGDKEVKRLVIPADDLMQAFLNRHLVPAEKMVIEIVEKRWAPVQLKAVLEEAETLRIPMSGETNLTFVSAHTKKKWIDPKYVLTLKDPPEGLKITKTSVSKDKKTLTVTLETKENAEKLQYSKGNLVFNIVRQWVDSKKVTKKATLCATPAVPFEMAEIKENE